MSAAVRALTGPVHGRRAVERVVVDDERDAVGAELDVELEDEAGLRRGAERGHGVLGEDGAPLGVRPAAVGLDDDLRVGRRRRQREHDDEGTEQPHEGRQHVSGSAVRAR